MPSFLPSDIIINDNVTIPASELRFSTSRSSGPGGQNVNKLETKVQLEFDIAASPSLPLDQKELLLTRLSSRLAGTGMLKITSQESRSQWINRKKAVEKFVVILRNALKPLRVRKPTKPSRIALEKRLERKKQRSETKQMRRRPTE